MLIHCVAYQDGRRLADIDVGDIGRDVSRPDCFVWVALRDADAAELAAMQQQFALHPLAVEDALKGHQRPKLEEYGDPRSGRWARPSGPSSAALARRKPQPWPVPWRAFATPPAWSRTVRSGA